MNFFSIKNAIKGKPAEGGISSLPPSPSYSLNRSNISEPPAAFYHAQSPYSPSRTQLLRHFFSLPAQPTHHLTPALLPPSPLPSPSTSPSTSTIIQSRSFPRFLRMHVQLAWSWLCHHSQLPKRYLTLYDSRAGAM